MPLNEEKKSEANKSIPFEIKNSLYDSSSALAALLRCNQKLLKSSMAQLYPNEQHNKKKEPSMVAKKRRKLEGSKDVSQSAGHDSSSGDSKEEVEFYFARNCKEEVEFYLCTKQELLVNKFPLPDDKELEGYITLPEKRNDEGISPRLFGIDCEMVRTEGDEAPAPGEKGRLDLARVSVVNEDHKTVYDKFVKPARRILDYCTKWSGITPELLEGEGVLTLKEVQRDLCDMLTSHDVLVGHSLENDLHALRIVHTKVLDTSILYPHPRGPPRKQSLKFISEKFLGRQIQKETEEGQKEMGHDSTEDAIAALELAQLKIKNGPTFGIQSPNTTGLFQILLCHRRSCAMFGSHKSVKQFAKPDSVNAIACSNDSETFRKLSSYCAKFDVCIANCSSILKNATEAKIKELDNGIRRVYQKCPRNTLLIVLSGQGPSEELLRLNKERAQKRNRWTLKEENELKWKEVSARKGVAFFTVKTEAAS
eukprot:CAMPEP_0167768002 /NCGR_PEP_ID=MMETSP0110_2-20121227/16389_1 /TAXON_ID=629695 /ORGANISM="Gymnochlora sp., Strain CCMP2014" /LENGTH=479 /DNA_ID=CAMNT_0007656555 /DNA_START=235 /DNA_END=1675 /DNA_ORIENTATION=+